jgi:hypothetical protein
MIIAIDPGPTESALIVWDGVSVCLKNKMDNESVLAIVRDIGADQHNICVIEQIASYGMAVGAEVFETCFWSGRFAEAFGAVRVNRITRSEVKIHLCHSMRARDGNVRRAVIDRFGGKVAAIGNKKAPGPLYGISGDCWAALAVAVTWRDRHAGSVAA